MLRQAFDQKLQTLQVEVLDLGSSVDTALGAAVEALTCQDLLGARSLLYNNHIITGKRTAIEADTLSQIATQQPVAGDLRILIAMLEISAELERMGRYVGNIAQTTLNLAAQPLPEPFPQLIPQMGDKARGMLDQALVAFAQRDVIQARAIPALDDEVDYFYSRVGDALGMVIKLNPENTTQAAYLSRVAHNLERTADRVVNICEWVVFAVTGEMKELN